MIHKHASCCSYVGKLHLLQVVAPWQKWMNASFYELPNFLRKIRLWNWLFPELLRPACILSRAFQDGGLRETNVHACRASHVRPRPTSSVPLLDWVLVIVLEVEWTDEEGGGVKWAGCGSGRAGPDSSRGLGLWGVRAAGYLECCRDRGARSYRHARCSVPRELCQRGQEEKTHSSTTQWECLQAHCCPSSVSVGKLWHVNRLRCVIYLLDKIPQSKKKPTTITPAFIISLRSICTNIYWQHDGPC